MMVKTVDRFPSEREALWRIAHSAQLQLRGYLADLSDEGLNDVVAFVATIDLGTCAWQTFQIRHLIESALTDERALRQATPPTAAQTEETR